MSREAWSALLPMSELIDFAGPVLVVAGAFSLSILATQLADRLPVPAPAVFLIAAAVASDLWPRSRCTCDPDGRAHRRHRADRHPVQRRHRYRLAAPPRVAGADHVARPRAVRLSPPAVSPAWRTGCWGWTGRSPPSLGAALAPTDPAVAFSVLGGRELCGPAGTTLEGEAGRQRSGRHRADARRDRVDHPLRRHVRGHIQDFVVEMAIGPLSVWRPQAARAAARHVRLPSESLYPVFGRRWRPCCTR